MIARKVPPSVPLLTDADARELLAPALLRLCQAHGPTRVARNLGGIDEKTVRNARDEISLLSLDSAFNLLALDDHALDLLLAHFGRRAVPIDARCDSDVMVSTSAALHVIAADRSPLSLGGALETDDEKLAQEPVLEAAAEGIAARLSEIAEIKRRRAARAAA